VQLDLFDFPPPPMNPNRNPMAPDCFRDYTEYSEWLGLARAAKERCTICEDCDKEYQTKMKLQERCHQEWYSITLLPPIKPQIRLKKVEAPKIIEKNEFNNDKLYWEFK